MAFDDQGVEVFRLLLVEPLETEVIDDKQVGSEVAVVMANRPLIVRRWVELAA